MKVFLGGTCGGSNWRDKAEQILIDLDIRFFNPVVKDWTPACQQEEIKQRKTCDKCLYVITPQMEGVYSIAEVVDDSNKRPEKTIFVVLKKHLGVEFNKTQLKSLYAVSSLVIRNGGTVLNSLEELRILLKGGNNESSSN